MENKFITIDDFELGKPLGTGKFGQVWLARHKEKKYVVAIKMILLKDVKNDIHVKNIRREVEVNLALDHPNILKMYGYFYDGLKLYFVLEYAGKGDVWKHIRQSSQFPESKASQYIRQMCLAVQYLHSQNIIHRDIKPENILIGCDDNLKLADFGWSVYNCDKKRNTICGTAEYLPPEMCREELYDCNADIWCLGILSYEFCTGKTPFNGRNNLRATKQKILTSELDFPPYLSDECTDFISRCCCKDPSRRITLDEAFSHPFITKYQNYE